MLTEYIWVLVYFSSVCDKLIHSKKFMSELIIIEDYCRKTLHSPTMTGQMEESSKDLSVS